MRRLGCASSLFGGPLEEALASIARAGGEEVDLWAVPHQCEHVRPAIDDPDAVAEQVRAAGLHANALSLYGCRGAQLDDGLEWAARAGVPRVVFESFGPDFRGFLEPYLARAAELGVEVCVENHIDCPVDSIASARRLFEQVDSPVLGLAYAPIHSAALGEPVEQALAELAPWIRLLYVWDVPQAQTGVAWLREHWHRTGLDQLPGYGRLDFAALAPLLPDGADLSLCAHGTQDWPAARVEAELVRSRDYLRMRGWPV